ncbi:hypothetical protein [Polyangium spumosum]|uniref:Cytochrome P460 domain-containing protein n=1 Tax=Polyangium spumosum TaxID=889282 RepID=A0A6N7Q1D6_9BACT|nr:hypothetical protein [Polyangium spumosum]MRG96415.1 hypothetical protein [Polyangium spumosum]
MQTRLERLLWIAAMALFAAAAPGCRQDDDPAGADELWTRIQDAKYRAWERAPGYESRKASSAPHGDQVEIFVNDVVAGALDGPAITAWPEGSIVVKDGFDDDGSPHIVAAMEKRGGAWFYAEWDPDGESLYSGAPSICTDCHAAGADMIRAFGFPK